MTDPDIQIVRHHLDRCHRLMAEQDKLIANLTEENERLKPPAKKMIGVLKSKPGKNKSWRNSAWLGLREGIWMAPSVALKHLGPPVGMLAAGVVLLVGKLLLCPIGILVTTGLGLCGYLVEKEEIERQ